MFPECYKILEEGFDDPATVLYVLGNFFVVDGANYATAGEAEALDWTRKVIATHGTNTPSQGFDYLMLKGNASDIGLLNEHAGGYSAEILKERVEGGNLFGDPRTFSDGIGLFFIPSVANTGPQAVYVGEILFRAWEEAGMDISKIPSELLTMVVTFDGNGNPVCNVDLAKHGLSMPVISTEAGERIAWQNKDYAVTFPDLEETIKTRLRISRKREPRLPEQHIKNNLLFTATRTTTPQDEADTAKPVIEDVTKQPIQETEFPPSEQPQTPPKNRSLLWLGILVLAVISAVTAWRLAKRKR